MLDVVYTDGQRDLVQEMHRWMANNRQASCSFMAERLRSAHSHAYNQNAFRSLANHLVTNRTVRYVPSLPFFLRLSGARSRVAWVLDPCFDL